MTVFKEEDFKDIFTWGARAAAYRANDILEKKGFFDRTRDLENLVKEMIHAGAGDMISGDWIQRAKTVLEKK